MDDWFNRIQEQYKLPSNTAYELHEKGFVVLQNTVDPQKLPHLVAAYDAAVVAANPHDVGIGRSDTRVHDFVNRGPHFDDFYIQPQLLAASCAAIGQPFKLSSMHSRTVRPGAKAQALHVDFPRDAAGWPMVGFIIMMDEFRNENGATRFVPGSHCWPQVPDDVTAAKPTEDCDGQVLACGPAGSVIIYNGSIWHGYSANQTDQPRRSIQGAYIRRTAQSWINQADRIRPDTLDRIGDLAKYLLDL